jgi:hypothetical protein
MTRLFRLSISNSIAVVLAVLLSAPAPAVATRTRELAPQGARCTCLSGYLVSPSDQDFAFRQTIYLVLREDTTQFVPHVGDWEIPLWEPARVVPFLINYDWSRIDPGREYILSAAVRGGDGQLVFISNYEPKVITLGYPSCNIPIQLYHAPPAVD